MANELQSKETNATKGSEINPTGRSSVLRLLFCLPILFVRWLFFLVHWILSVLKNLLRRLYDWVLSWAHSRYGTVALAGVSFAESSFFPIPPDVLQIALSIERPKRSFYYALVSAVASVLGAVLGWFIGYALWESVGPYFVPNLISQANMDKVTLFFKDWGFLALFAAALTPIPFKAFTISAGIGGMSIPLLMAAAFIGRGLRFFMVATLIYFFGPMMKGWIDRYFGILTLTFLALLILGIYSIKYLL